MAHILLRVWNRLFNSVFSTMRVLSHLPYTITQCFPFRTHLMHCCARLGGFMENFTFYRALRAEMAPSRIKKNTGNWFCTSQSASMATFTSTFSLLDPTSRTTRPNVPFNAEHHHRMVLLGRNLFDENHCGYACEREKIERASNDSSSEKLIQNMEWTR